MSKSKNKLTINADNVSDVIDVLTELSKPVAITNAIIKDGMCKGFSVTELIQVKQKKKRR